MERRGRERAGDEGRLKRVDDREGEVGRGREKDEKLDRLEIVDQRFCRFELTLKDKDDEGRCAMKPNGVEGRGEAVGRGEVARRLGADGNGRGRPR